MVKRSLKHINGYSKGVNKDLSFHLYDNQHYLDSEWLTPVINEEGKIGTVTNPKGTVQKINLPSGQTVIGDATIRDTIIIIAATTTGNTYIYTFVDDGTTTPQVPTSLYNDSALSSYLKLGYDNTTELDIISRYENEDIQKIYFAAEGHPLRSCNIVDSFSGFTQYDFNIIPAVSLSKPEFSEYTNGNKESGKVSYTYQLYKINGPETSFSQTSVAIPISSSVRTSDVKTLYGSELEKNCGIGVKLTINNLDTNFERIRILSFDYIDNISNPSVNIIYEGSFTSTTLTVVDNGSSLGEYDLAVFRTFNQFFILPQYLTQKSNILFAGNLEEKYFDIDQYLVETGQTGILTTDAGGSGKQFWDSRSYRFKNPSGTVYTQLYTSSGALHNTIYASSPDYTVVNYNADCVNNYNLVSNNASYYGNSNGDKFQTNGTTLGGNGDNVSFQFDVEIWNMDNTILSKNLGGAIQDEHLGLKLGWQRDEVYRTYIQFEDNLGRKSFPKWIGDIRTPNQLDGSAYASIISTNLGYTRAHTIYPKFRVNNIPNNPDGTDMRWRILRVKRDALDRTVIGTGIASATFVDPYAGADAGSPFELIGASVYQGGTYTHPNTATTTINNTFIQLVSPELTMSDIDINSFELHHVGYYNYSLTNTYYYRYTGGFPWVNYASTPASLNSGKVQIVRKIRGSGKSTYTTEANRIRTITDWLKVSPNPSNSDEFSAISSVGSTSYRHISESSNTAFAYACTCIVAKLSSAFGFTAANVITDAPNLGLMLVNIKNPGIPYGGNSYEARLRNISIPASDFVTTTGSYVTAYYGDTIISYFDYLRNQTHTDLTDAYQEDLYLPFESQYNFNFRHDKSFSDIVDAPFDTNFLLKETGLVNLDTGLELSRLYQYNIAYSRENDAEVYTPILEDTVDNYLYDSRVRRSQVKFNGEFSDSWLKFLEDDYIDVDSQFGEIKSLDIFNDRLLFFQETGFGVLPVGEKELIPSNTSATLALGSSGVLNRYDYLSDTIGISQNKAVRISPNSVYIYSQVYNTMYRFTGNSQPLSDIAGMNSWFDQYVNTSTIIRSAYNPLLKEIIFQFNNRLVVFSELNNSFIYNYPIGFSGVSYFIEFKNDLYSFGSNLGYKHNIGDRGYIHTSFYPSTITILINPGGTVMNVYDVLELLTEEFSSVGIELTSTFTSIQITNDYQDSGVLTLTPNTNIKRRFRTWRFNTIRDNSTLSPKIRSSYIKVKLSYTNVDNKQILLHNLITNYSPSKMRY